MFSVDNIQQSMMNGYSMFVWLFIVIRHTTYFRNMKFCRTLMLHNDSPFWRQTVSIEQTWNWTIRLTVDCKLTCKLMDKWISISNDCWLRTLNRSLEQGFFQIQPFSLWIVTFSDQSSPVQPLTCIFVIVGHLRIIINFGYFGSFGMKTNMLKSPFKFKIQSPNATDKYKTDILTIKFEMQLFN